RSSPSDARGGDLMIRHPDHIYCIHIYGWVVSAWCGPCRKHWEETCGVPHCRSYEQLADRDLARAVCLAMQDGEIPGVPEVNGIEILSRNPNPEPSDN